VIELSEVLVALYTTHDYWLCMVLWLLSPVKVSMCIWIFQGITRPTNEN